MDVVLHCKKKPRAVAAVEQPPRPVILAVGRTRSRGPRAADNFEGGKHMNHYEAEKLFQSQTMQMEKMSREYWKLPRKERNNPLRFAIALFKRQPKITLQTTCCPCCTA